MFPRCLSDCEFVGFKGDNPPLLVSSDSYAAVRNCTFRDMDLSVELFDVSFGGGVHLEDCTFQNIQLRRTPPKYVSTSLNDEFRCDDPYDDFFKYQADDDDYYDITPQLVNPDDASAGLYIDSATMSDCLRPLTLYACKCLSVRVVSFVACIDDTINCNKRVLWQHLQERRIEPPHIGFKNEQ